MKIKLLLILSVLSSSLVSCASTVSLSINVPEVKPLAESDQDTLSICSFNIQFLGHFKERNDTLLTSLLEEYDIVVIQEMVAPPIDGEYGDGSTYKADRESASFHNLMTEKGFNYWLSSEDTGPTKNHTNSSASEWWIVYYNDKVMPDTLSEPYGFLSDTLVGHSKFQRVPYSFAMKTISGSTTFNLISVHLNPGGSFSDKAIRHLEFKGIYEWINLSATKNKDYIVLGDCNVEDLEELKSLIVDPFEEKYQSLNSACVSTNTKRYEAESKGKPYDHIFVNAFFNEDLVYGSFQAVDLQMYLEKVGRSEEFFPYAHDYFRTRLSDHLPVTFKIITGKDTD